MNNQRVKQLVSYLQESLKPLDVVKTECKLSDLADAQDKIFVVTNKDQIVGFYIGFEASKNIPNEYKLLFMHMINVYGSEE